jgi:signal recognition particle subunit SRP54
MVLDSLSGSLSNAIKKLMRAPVVDEKVVKELVRDIQRALLQSDVNVKLVFDLSKSIEKKILEADLPPGITRRELAVKVVYDELTELLGGEKAPQPKYQRGKPTVVMLVGIQGSGKTTSASKLTWFFKKQGLTVGLVCADNFRAGAYDQLKQLSEQAEAEFYGERDSPKAAEIARNGVSRFKEKGIELIIVDTAGRHKNESDLIAEMGQIAEAVSPDEIILVLDGTIGQQAMQQAEAFNKATKIGTIFLTKLDGTAKGGGALSAVAATKAPIKFIGTGEGIDEIEVFSPPRFVGRLLGMGDIESLVEKVKELQATTGIKPDMATMASGRFTLKDLYKQMQALRKMGSLTKILQSIPGLGMNVSKEAMDISEENMKKWLVIMQSMTDAELTEPHIIDGSRARRIAKGSGTQPKDVKELLDQYKMSKKFIKQMVTKQKRLPGSMKGGQMPRF